MTGIVTVILFFLILLMGFFVGDLHGFNRGWAAYYEVCGDRKHCIHGPNDSNTRFSDL